MMKKTTFRVLFAAFLITMFCSSAAYADTFRIRIEDYNPVTGGGTGVVISDNSLGDLSVQNGNILFSGMISPNFNVFMALALTYTALGDEYNAQLNLSSTVQSLTGMGTLRITLEHDYFNIDEAPQALFTGTMGGSTLNAAIATGQYQSAINFSNAMPLLGADASAPGALAPIAWNSLAEQAQSQTAWSGDGESFSGTSFSDTSSAVIVPTVPNTDFSMYSQATLTFTGPGLVNFTGASSVLADRSGTRTYTSETITPEPTSLLLLATGLSLGLFGKRKQTSET